MFILARQLADVFFISFSKPRKSNSFCMVVFLVDDSPHGAKNLPAEFSTVGFRFLGKILPRSTSSSGLAYRGLLERFIVGTETSPKIRARES